MERMDKTWLFRKYTFEVRETKILSKIISALTFYSWSISLRSDEERFYHHLLIHKRGLIPRPSKLKYHRDTSNLYLG